MTEHSAAALAGITIIEIASRVSGEYCGKLLADFGAEVIKVEPAGGAPTRRMGPFVQGESALFAYLNTNKKSVVLDLETASDRAILDGLLARANALIDDHSPQWGADHGLSYAAVAARHAKLVHCAITPFGQAAPADWQIARSLNVINAGGWAYHTPSEATPDRPPLKGAGRFLADYESGIDAALATLASLYRQRKTGCGQFIDINEVAVQISRNDCVFGRMLAGEAEAGPERTRYDMGGPGAAFPARDGHVFLVILTQPHWQALRKLMGNPPWTDDFPPDWLEFHCTPQRVAQFRAHFAPWIAGQAKDTISAEAQQLGLPMVPVNTAADLPGNPQFSHRGFFQRLPHPLLGVQSYPTVPYSMSASPVRLSSPAPMLGQHDAQAKGG